jgi:hypothetical protein
MSIARVIGQIVAVVDCVLVLIGAHFYGIPFLSPIGSTVLSICGPWLVVVPNAIGAFEFCRWGASHSRATLLLMLTAIAATEWSSVALARMLAECRTHGVPIDLIRTLGMRIISAQCKTTIHGGGFTMGDRFESGSNLRWSPIAGGSRCRSTMPFHRPIDISGISRPVKRGQARVFSSFQAAVRSDGGFVQRRFALGLAEILSKHIAEQRTLLDGVVEGDMGMEMRVEPMFGHAAFSAFAVVLS